MPLSSAPGRVTLTNMVDRLEQRVSTMEVTQNQILNEMRRTNFTLEQLSKHFNLPQYEPNQVKPEPNNPEVNMGNDDDIENFSTEFGDPSVF